jgi:hypothetical protein
MVIPVKGSTWNMGYEPVSRIDQPSVFRSVKLLPGPGPRWTPYFAKWSKVICTKVLTLGPDSFIL